MKKTSSLAPYFMAVLTILASATANADLITEQLYNTG